MFDKWVIVKMTEDYVIVSNQKDVYKGTVSNGEISFSAKAKVPKSFIERVVKEYRSVFGLKRLL